MAGVNSGNSSTGSLIKVQPEVMSAQLKNLSTCIIDLERAILSIDESIDMIASGGLMGKSLEKFVQIYEANREEINKATKNLAGNDYAACEYLNENIDLDDDADQAIKIG